MTIIDVKKVAIDVVNVISASGAHISASELILEEAKQYIKAQRVASVQSEPNSSHSTPTCELVNELSNRKGVNVYNIDPNVKLAMDMGEDGFTETGPFKIFIVKD